MATSRDAVASGGSQAEGLEDYRRELTGYCYRMLGSGFEADDAVQETMLRAWRSADQFEGRSSLRSWLYRIATNVCLDMLRGRKRRALPMELGAPSPPKESNLGPMLPEHSWVSPIADARVLPSGGDPAEIAVARESIRLAFVTALQHLPARQRATLILCEVLRWPAAEVAELLETSVAAVNSALQRARTTLSAVRAEQRPQDVDGEYTDLLNRYVDAFQRYDIAELVTLVHEDAVMSMPPYAMWIQGAENIGRWMTEPGPSGCRGSRLLPAAANGCPALGQYRIDPAGGYAPWALQVHEISGGLISRSVFFLDAAALFPAFGLPSHLPG
ncbi:MAG TPA: sigma-70 family RNA polymerase sigma factor [Streptosporangiaceae bacterium]|nr:sigma-70 family RNA polymerase sigma factor [Streptosporangiaceae bacterium]